jgi:putative membrane protein
VQSMLRFEKIRNKAFQTDGRAQIEYPKSNVGWFKSLMLVKGRAFDLIVWPWAFSTLHATIYTCIQELAYGGMIDRVFLLESWETFFSLVLSSTLAFLLVFRLNRAADRYWTARRYWGDIVAKGRNLVSGLLVYGDHDPIHRDHSIRWLVALSISIMELLRNVEEWDGDMFAGILVKEEVETLRAKQHPALYACTQVRYHLKKLLDATVGTPVGIAHARALKLDRLERQLNIMLDCCGGMERIRSSPLPVVYVTHLRTFLFLTLLLLPYVWGRKWRWTTIPLTALAWY